MIPHAAFFPGSGSQAGIQNLRLGLSGIPGQDLGHHLHFLAGNGLGAIDGHSDHFIFARTGHRRTHTHGIFGIVAEAIVGVAPNHSGILSVGRVQHVTAVVAPLDDLQVRKHRSHIQRRAGLANAAAQAILHGRAHKDRCLFKAALCGTGTNYRVVRKDITGHQHGIVAKICRQLDVNGSAGAAGRQTGGTSAQHISENQRLKVLIRHLRLDLLQRNGNRAFSCLHSSLGSRHIQGAAGLSGQNGIAAGIPLQIQAGLADVTLHQSSQRFPIQRLGLLHAQRHLYRLGLAQHQMIPHGFLQLSGIHAVAGSALVHLQFTVFISIARRTVIHLHGLRNGAHLIPQRGIVHQQRQLHHTLAHAGLPGIHHPAENISHPAIAIGPGHRPLGVIMHGAFLCRQGKGLVAHLDYQILRGRTAAVLGFHKRFRLPTAHAAHFHGADLDTLINIIAPQQSHRSGSKSHHQHHRNTSRSNARDLHPPIGRRCFLHTFAHSFPPVSASNRGSFTGQIAPMIPFLCHSITKTPCNSNFKTVTIRPQTTQKSPFLPKNRPNRKKRPGGFFLRGIPADSIILNRPCQTFPTHSWAPPAWCRRALPETWCRRPAR